MLSTRLRPGSLDSWHLRLVRKEPLLERALFRQAAADSLQRGEYIYWLDDLHWNAAVRWLFRPTIIYENGINQRRVTFRYRDFRRLILTEMSSRKVTSTLRRDRASIGVPLIHNSTALWN